MHKVPIWVRRDVNDLGITPTGIPIYGFICGVKKQCLTNKDYNMPSHGDPWINLGLTQDKAFYTFEIIKKIKNRKYFYPIYLPGHDFSKIQEWLEIEPAHIKNIKAGRCKILIYNSMEGWNHFRFANMQIREICNKYNLTAKNFVLLTGNMDDTGYSTPNVYHNWWEFHMYFEDFNDLISAGTHSQLNKRKNKFICLNRRPHAHRLALSSLLYKYKDKGILTCAKEVDHGSTFVLDNSWETIDKFYPSLKNDIENILLPELPLQYDDGINAADDNPTVDRQADKFYNSWLHIVTETFHVNGQTFFSEKIFKPIYRQQLFILIGAYNDLKGLRKLGYKTFSPFIDESYDDIEDPEKRLLAAFKEIERLIHLSDQELLKIYEDCNDIIVHNFFHWLYRMQTINVDLRKNLLEALDV